MSRWGKPDRWHGPARTTGEQTPRRSAWQEAMDPANRQPEPPRPDPYPTPLAELPPDELEAMRQPARPPTHGRDFDPYA